MTIRSQKKENILRPWQSRIGKKEKHFTSTTITWRLGAEIELSAEIEKLNHA
jgi:hypothetical protein